jgi:hypothetical protein
MHASSPPAGKRRLAFIGPAGIVTAIAVIAAGFVAGCTYGGQPHMQAALSYLQSAYGELQVAEHNKGGHRVVAMRLISDAITEVQAGIAVGGSGP